MSRGEAFLARWSRRKSADRRNAGGRATPAGETPAMANAAPAADQAALRKLPPLDSLTKDSDFSPFLRPGVPEPMKLAALRRLWATDPVWAEPERLDLHNLDYTQPTLAALVRTVYRVGEGFGDGRGPAAPTKVVEGGAGEATEAPQPEHVADAEAPRRR
jgi:hypothetical protein